MRSLLLHLVSACLLCAAMPAWATDWPAWRYDAGHTAASPGDLPDRLQLEWTRVYSPRKQAWLDPLNQDMMQYDRVFEPIVKDGRVFLGFNDADKVVALDVKTGEKLWTFYTGGPVRFPAVAWQDTVLFVSDDGYLYCVSAETGQLKWKYQGAPGSLKVIGNERLISAWPARGGPVVHEGQVYFAASIWPFMGTFIYCLDATSGELVWVNDSTSSQYIKQPHSAASFAGVGPQGTFTITGDSLLVPGGRSIAAAFNRKTGEMRHFLLDEGGKGNGGSLVLALGDEYYVHTRVRGVRAFELESGKKTAFATNEPVLEKDLLGQVRIFAAERVVPAKPGAEAKAEEDESAPAPPAADSIPVIRCYNGKKEMVWELRGVDGSGEVIKAGKRLYAAGGGQLTALDLNADGSGAEVAWKIPTEPNVQRLLAANGKLLAVTLEGSLLCYGDSNLETPLVIDERPQVRPVPQEIGLAEKIAEQVGARQGFVLWFGEPSEVAIDALLATTQFDLVVVDTKETRIDQLRRLYDEAGVHGKRVSFHVGSIDSFQAPAYVAHAVVLAGSAAESARLDRELLRRAYHSVRPYGGALVVLPGDASGDASSWPKALEEGGLESAEVLEDAAFFTARRVGALPGSADWTHQYGNIANTVKSNDARVKLPLGLLWFGGSSNLDVLPRHGHGPPEQVVGGRLYIEGMNSLNCRDVYTGRVLWKRTFDNLGTYDIYYDDTYKDTPLDPAYNQVHIPGANGRGTNFVATEDAVYMIEGDSCHVIDLDTGETRQRITLPDSVRGENRQWAYIGVYKDLLFAGAGYANYGNRLKVSFEDTDSKLGTNSKGFGSKSLNVSASAALIAFNRHTGAVVWQADARHSFIHNGIVAGDGKVFCLDKLPGPVEERLKRRGQDAPETYRILALDAQTGEKAWEQTGKIFGTWLGYSEEFHLLLQAGAAADDRLESEVGQGMAVYRGENGDVVWRVENRPYSGPCILHHDRILTNADSYRYNAGAFSLLDGNPVLIENPLTKEKQPWQLSRTYGCNSIIASENLLTFRSGAAGFYDLQSMSGTGSLGGFKSGCTSNLVVANGVLNAPDYTRTCSCGYQNQSSLALIHMPEMDMWTLNHVARLSKPGQSIQQLGLNFGAPGDRRHPNGTLWVDYPAIGGESAEIDIQVEGDASYYRRNTLAFSGPGEPWIGASGVVNATRIVVPLSIRQSNDEVRVPIRAAEDDAEEKADGSVVLDSSDIELVEDDSRQTVGLRFDKVPLERTRKILSAHLQFVCDEATEGDTQVAIAIEDATQSAPFAKEAKNLSGRRLAGSPVAWTIPKWDAVDRADEAERSPDLAELVRGIIGRPDWSPENALTLLLTGEGKRVAKAMEGGADKAPTLVLKVEPLPPASVPAVPHTVRLYFAEPDATQPGERVFDVLLQGQTVIEDMDVVQEAGRPRKTIVREFTGVALTDRLVLEMKAEKGQPILCGLEIVREP